LVLEADPLNVVFEQPITAAPGEAWVYSSGDSMLLGHILKVATGKNATALATERLAAPLGMSALEWWQDGAGATYTFCCVDTTSRDFAKFGQLFLQRGVWGGEQIVSAAWVEQATSPQAAGNRGYGFQWWLNHPEATSDVWPSLPQDAYFALGHNGQYVAVFPSSNLVVVRNGEYLAPDYPAIAPDGLFAAGLWSDDLGPTGTREPEGDWDEETFFGLILAAVD
jgi:CubicO group peptidase (beta-lactamase class C family)